MKICSKCKKEKSILDFNKDKHRKDGLYCSCKICAKEYRQNNKKKIRLRHKKYYTENKEKINLSHKEYRENNKEKEQIRHKKYLQENKEQIKKYYKEYRENNKEKEQIRQQKWCQENKEKNRRWHQQYCENNKEEIRLKAKIFYQENKEEINLKSKVFYQENKEKIKLKRQQYRKENSEEINKKNNKYSQENREKINNRNNKRYKEDVSYRLAVNLRSRFRSALKNKQKVGSAVRDLGCSVEFLKSYLESKFQSNMTWQNHSYYGWHIDHIKPLAFFDLTDRKQFLEACHYTNLQPMWCQENLSKGSKV